MARLKRKSRLLWLVSLLPMTALPLAIPASAGSGVPLGVSLVTWGGFLALPALLCLFLIRLDHRLKRYSRMTSHAVMGLVGGIPYLILVGAWIGLSSLHRMEFNHGPCAFLSRWHWGHLLAPAGLVLFAAVLCAVECLKSSRLHTSQPVRKLHDAQQPDSQPAIGRVAAP